MATGEAPTGHPKRLTSFVGRTAELAELTGLLDLAREGTPTTLLVHGEAGVGKSRLLREFADQARASGARVLTGSCIPVGSGELPYAPLIEALRRLSRQLAREPGQERLLEELAGAGYPELARLVSGYTGAPAPPPEATLEATAEQPRVFGAVRRLFNELGAAGPVVFIVEDLHLADLSTLDLLGYLTRTVDDEQLLLIGSYRLPPPIPPRLHNLAVDQITGGSVQRLEVSRFGRAELGEFLRAAAPAETGHDLLERTLELSDGNAFFVEQLLAAGALAAPNPIGPVRVPGSIRDVALDRYEKLGPDAQEVIRVAATAGRRVSEQLLIAVVEMSDDRLLEALRECVNSQMLEAERVTETYAFRHALLREVVHQDLLPGESARLHKAIAAALEEESGFSYAGELTVAAELSYHWYEGRVYPKALAAAVQAGDQAVGLMAFRDAGLQYERALAVWPLLKKEDPAAVAGVPKLRLLALAADAARWAGRLDRAVELARETVDLVDPGVEPVRAGELRERLASLLWESTQAGPAEEMYAEAARLLAGASPSPAVARVRAAQASARIRAGRYEEGLPLAREALAMAQSIEARAEEGRARNTMGLALAMLGEAEDGVRELGQAVTIADECGQLEDLFRAYGNLSFVLLSSGQAEKTIEVATVALDRARLARLSLTQSIALLANNAAAAFVMLGQWNEATAIVEGWRRQRPAAESLFIRLTMIEVMVGRGQFDAVDQALAEVRVAGAAERQPQFVGSLHAYMAESAIWRNDRAAAREAVAAGLAEVEGTDDLVIQLKLCALGLRNAADEWLALRKRPGPVRTDRRGVSSMADELGSMVRRLSAERRGRGLPEVAPLLRLCEAEQARAGQTDQPAAWAAVAAAWTQLRWPYQTAYAQFREAEAAIRVGDRERAKRAARAAHEVAAGLPATPLRAAIESLVGVDIARARPGPGRPANSEPDGIHLTGRERAVLALIYEGKTNREIGNALGISPKTASVHVYNLRTKLQAPNRTTAAIRASQRGLLRDSATDPGAPPVRQ